MQFYGQAIGFHIRLGIPPTRPLRPVIPNNACTLRITAAAGTELAGAYSYATVIFLTYKRSLHTEMRHPPRGVAASGFPPLCNIPHCCLPQESGPCSSASVADHPLKPATRHCLGKPLPYQLTDGIQADLLAKNFPDQHQSQKEYLVLIIVSNGYPRLRGTLPINYSPVRHSSASSKLLLLPFDLHVLSTPPAFILSQDQTLHNYPCTLR
eukprot:TRINITY_DN403_c0_g1_i3.p1 TRINITY_DN403_c0_g1~~TRINITY_DN403_c0_g1_i3.p1  ORF type:complete len:210 (-),score=-35.62 TRINITY_DN403_c0_g1_i3:109-738(-)